MWEQSLQHRKWHIPLTPVSLCILFIQDVFIYGNINVYEFKDNDWKLIKYKNDDNTQTGVLIQDIYEINLLDTFKNNNVKVSNYNYLDRRKKEEQLKKRV